MDASGFPTRTDFDENGKSPSSRLRHKRPLSSILPSAPTSSARTSPRVTHHRSRGENEGTTNVVNFSSVACPAPAEAATATIAPTNSSSSSSAPWGLSLSEGLDFCRDGAALLRQLYQRIEATGQQLGAATSLPTFDANGDVKGDGVRNAEGGCGEEKGEGRLVEHQQLLKEEIDDCLVQIQELRRLLLFALSLIKSNPVLEDTANEADGGPRGEAVLKAMKLFRLDSTAGENLCAEPLASSLVGVLSGVRRFMSALASRIHTLENSAAVWLTHGSEIIPYLKHLQNSLKELQQQEEETTGRAEEVKQRINLKVKEKESVHFCLEKTKDEFRQARLDLTREELEKIPAKERMTLLETKRETLDRELRSLAAFSPLFIVERAAKYITLQYRPEGSSIDYEISIEGLDLSFAQGGSRLSRFFSVHVQPPNDRVRRLLESGIGELLQKLSTKQAPAQQVREQARGYQTAEGSAEAAGDKVVEYIAAILIKTLSSSFTTPNTAPLYLSVTRACPSREAVQTN
ncbi:non-muscle myosin heavy chain, putative [Eimeria praecox]|uniref:Non-muscle myosin heavy chain, putative n=1 Tax=Eimeria praecox TaxID=51316 RepID=U6GA11_9EIME|nr:non-muscle myosin heavy chain, putative [Eimeria praecox]